jgi:hypothetical protein
MGAAVGFLGSDGKGRTVSPSDPLPIVTGFSIPKHDYVELSYTGSDMTGVTYKLGGTWDTSTNIYTGGTTVGQLELVYDGGNLVQIVEV